MGRKRRWREDMQARFPEGTFARIAAALIDTEDRTEFARTAVENELMRRDADDIRNKRRARATAKKNK